MACCCTAQLCDSRCAALETQLPLTLLTPNQGVQECVLQSVCVVQEKWAYRSIFCVGCDLGYCVHRCSEKRTSGEYLERQRTRLTPDCGNAVSTFSTRIVAHQAAMHLNAGRLAGCGPVCRARGALAVEGRAAVARRMVAACARAADVQARARASSEGSRGRRRGDAAADTATGLGSGACERSGRGRASGDGGRGVASGGRRRVSRLHQRCAAACCSVRACRSRAFSERQRLRARDWQDSIGAPACPSHAAW